MLRRSRRAVFVLAIVGLIAVAVVAASASPAFAYGKANYQVTFNGTATFPGGGGFGFWGWCDFAGGVSSGNAGDCELAQYVHSPGVGFTCNESLDITHWDGSGGTFVITGDGTARPAAVAAPCIAFFPGSLPFSGVDTGLPSAPGNYHFGQLVPGVPGEFNITVKQIP